MRFFQIPSVIISCCLLMGCYESVDANDSDALETTLGNLVLINNDAVTSFCACAGDPNSDYCLSSANGCEYSSPSECASNATMIKPFDEAGISRGTACILSAYEKDLDNAHDNLNCYVKYVEDFNNCAGVESCDATAFESCLTAAMNAMQSCFDSTPAPIKTALDGCVQ